MKITTVLPVSRIKYLDRVLESLVAQTHKTNNLLVVFDGNDNEFLLVRNKIVELDYENVLCVPSVNQRVAASIPDRRVHVTNIHNQVKEIIQDCDWVFCIEDDGVLPPDALAKLVENVQNYENVGMFTGVEIGRWGIPYVGAWSVDSVSEPSEVTSLENKTLLGGTIEEIDACGLYCGLVRADYYKQHNFFTNNGLGPDVNLALFLRQQGLQNYIDWTIHVTHLTYRDGEEHEIPATSKSHAVRLRLLSGSTWQY